jgi:ribosomal protein S6
MAETPQVVETSSQAEQNKQPVYEIGFHIVLTVGEDGIPAVVEKLRGELSKHEAEIIKDDFPRKIVLAYIIERAAAGKREKYADAYFGSIKFALERENIPALEVYLRSSKDILRYLLIETVREEVQSPRRAIFTSDRLEGERIQKPVSAPEQGGEVSEEELNKSIDALVN